MLVVTFTILGDTVLARGISRFGDSIRDFRPVWEQVRTDFHRIEDEQFDTEGARSGNTWAPLSLSYAAWKAKNFPGQPILRRTGMMWGQFAVGTGMVTEVEPMRLLMAPSMQYPVYHQQGTRRMPARKVVALTEDDKMGWMKMIHGYIYDKAREARLL